MDTRWSELLDFMDKGGVAIWVIAGLGALTGGLILWKLLRLAALRVWRAGPAERAVQAYLDGDATAGTGPTTGTYGRPITATITVMNDSRLDDTARREEIGRVASGEIQKLRSGLRGLELIATVAPLVGLLGTVLGMVTAFQALEQAGSRADPSALAGGIWEALLTTAAGMAIAIPAQASLAWFESIAERAQARIEDMVTRLLVAPRAATTSARRFMDVAE
ncbi:MotA/TolQ/ExbB proton channel family protein [Maritimibacter sp. DP1N21-5]|uniref:MotA/TolQ/ExbB proton channel family protein n=1 Tax=Maritimibacter sp. DP1N21-5 TaxID=2836867 RepID=UPI002104A23D|nr:MotA/TolQ/ExbB proton channel family protein [Maritimibacter sp. DP1N21-5]